MTVETLYPQFANLFGDSGNIRYLKACLPGADFVDTPPGQTPFFADHNPELLYLGPMTERGQLKAIAALTPWKERLRERINAGACMLFTGNAMEILGETIRTESGEEIPGLGILPLKTERDCSKRFNSPVLGRFAPIDEPVVGFQSQFTAHTAPQSAPFLTLECGRGFVNRPDSEGFCVQNLIATTLLGPLLVLNPPLTRRLLGIMGANIPLAHEETALEAYRTRVKELRALAHHRRFPV